MIRGVGPTLGRGEEGEDAAGDEVGPVASSGKREEMCLFLLPLLTLPVGALPSALTEFMLAGLFKCMTLLLPLLLPLLLLLLGLRSALRERVCLVDTVGSGVDAGRGGGGGGGGVDDDVGEFGSAEPST